MKHVLTWSVLMGLLLTIHACGGRRRLTEHTPSGDKDTAGSPAAKIAAAVTEFFSMTLFDAPFDDRQKAPLATPKTTRLSDKETAMVLARLDETLTPLSSDPKPFSLRPGSTPPPRAGERLTKPFPAERDVAPPKRSDAGPLEVIRYAPKGDVDLAPHLSVTFSKPMVSVTGQADAATTVPVALFPLPEGTWRWIGTQTLLFDPRSRFPMATDFKVEIPGGVQSADGDRLQHAVSFSFGTPPLKIEKMYPETETPQDLQPVIAIAFNQRINVTDVAEHVRLRSKEGDHRLDILTAAALTETPELHARFADIDADRLLLLRPAAPLPTGTLFEVMLDKGAPSAEGPKKTRQVQRFSFRTYDPFRVENHHCGFRDVCRPVDPLFIQLNNPIDEALFDPDAIVITPEPKARTINVYRRAIHINGQFSGRKRYTVTLPPSLTDTFGQRLGETPPLNFDIGPAEQAIYGPPRDLVTLDPGGPKRVSIHTVNHDALHVTIHRVSPADFYRHQQDFQASRRDDTSPKMPGKPLFDGEVRVDNTPDTLVETPIDLTPYLEKGFGQFLVNVVPATAEPPQHRRSEIRVWVQVTDLGLTAFVDNNELIAFVTRLKDGRPATGAAISLLGETDGPVAKSDESGLARLTLGKPAAKQHTLVATSGSDTAILPHSPDLQWGGGSWHRVAEKDEVRWYVFDDRGMYRPGETAHVKGWLRRFEVGKNGDIRSLDPLPKQIAWSLTGPRGNKLIEGRTSVSRLGGFHLALALPKEMNLGAARLALKAVGAAGLSRREWSHPLTVQEFRRPEFEVKVAGDPGPFVVGDEAFATLTAAYYAGGALSAAPTHWQVVATEAHFRPAGHEGYHFGPFRPWWFDFGPVERESSRRTFSGLTDSLGMHRLGIRFDGMEKPVPVSVQIHGRVTDVNRQAWSGSHQVMVHPASVYIGVKPSRNFLSPGAPLDLDAVVVDLDGKPVAGRPVALVFSKLTQTLRRGRHEETADAVGRCEKTSTGKPVRCTFTPETGGVYRIEARTTDADGRPNRTELNIWVAGEAFPTHNTVGQETLLLIPEKETYQPGETATLMVQSPFYPAEGVMTLERSGIVKTERFKMERADHVLTIPIEEAYLPNIRVQVDVVGASARTQPPSGAVSKRPAFASGALTLKVSPLKRTLKVTATPQKAFLSPGGKTSIDVMVQDAGGRPVENAEVVVVVADESVLALSGYTLLDPIEVFYAARWPGVTTYHSREQVILSDAVATGNTPGIVQTGSGLSAMDGRRRALKGKRDMAAAAGASTRMAPPPSPMPGVAMAEAAPAPGYGGGASNAPIALRTRFDALALFAPTLKTDSRGRTAVSIALPDSLTRYRIMAVAVARENLFGSGEAHLTARLPLMVRPSPPRFLNFGDRFFLPVVIQNQTDADLPVKIALRGSNIRLTEPLSGNTNSPANGIDSAGLAVTVPAASRAQVLFPSATLKAGAARFQAVAEGNAFADAATFALPVFTPATREAFATYGVIDRDGPLVQPVAPPKDVFSAFGALTVSAQSTELQALTDAVIYLADYPFDCAEQIASKILAIAALKDVLSAFAAPEMPSPEALERAVKDGIVTLGKMQNRDGGFGFWRLGDPSFPYLSVHVAHALAMANRHGFEAPKKMTDAAATYLTQIRKHLPGWYSPESRFAIRAYAIFALEALGIKANDAAAELLAEAGADKLSLEALGWIWPSLKRGGKPAALKAIRTRVNNSVTETAAGAHFVTAYTDGAQVLLHSDRRVDGILLDALIAVDPKNDLIPKLVRGLLDHRTQGRWSGTQENAFILLALNRYFRTFEKRSPDFVARAWLGDAMALKHRFKGRTTERVSVDVPLQYLLDQPATVPLAIDKAGKGRLYYRIGMTYAPRSLTLDPADHGFALARVYEGIDNPADVRQDNTGAWHIKAGARVKVTVTMATPMRRYHVALVDALPAGLEGVNPALAVEGPAPEDPGRIAHQPYWWWYRPWYEHQNIRDERVEAFTGLLFDGVHTYTYTAKATTPGAYIVPPARAEEMYHPETFGRTGTDRVVVE